MNCDGLASLLSLEDLDARIDSGAASAHMDTCTECATRWPEVAAIVEVAALARRAAQMRPARRLGRALAAGLVAAVLVALAFCWDSKQPASAARGADEAPAPVAIPGIALSSLSTETIEFDRGSRLASCVTETVWTAPTPQCLLGGAGS